MAYQVDKIPFFASFYDTFKKLQSDDLKVEWIAGLLGYAFEGEDPDFEEGTLLDFAWVNAQPTIENSVKRSIVNTNNGSKPKQKATTKANEKASDKATGKANLSLDEEKDKDRDSGKGSYKNHPSDDDSYSSASNGAVAVETAPPAAPRCPLCDQPVRYDAKSTSWRCSTCGEIKEPVYEAVEKS